MKRFSTRISLFVSIFVLYAWFGLVSAQEPARLNVLLIVADDLGLQLSTYGDRLVETPNIDRLAADGVQFDVAYVTQASCSTSRSSIFTGLYAHATGQYGLTNTGLSLHEDLRDRTMPNILKRAGYETGIIGKLHVAPEDDFRFDFNQYFNTQEVRKVAAEAGRFIDSVGEKPFFLMVNYVDPHTFHWPENRSETHFLPQVEGLPESPILPDERTIFPFQRIDVDTMRTRTAGYYNSVQRLDDGFGMLMEVVEQYGHREDTLIIFVGDHGPGFSRAKGAVYEAGLRIPFVIQWPGVSRPMRSRAMVSTVDILPTVLDATGVGSSGMMHGRSLRPILSESGTPWRRYLTAEFHFHGLRPFYPQRAIRNDRYKLIHNLLAGRWKPGYAGRFRPINDIDGDPAYLISQTNAFDGSDAQRVFNTFADPPEYELYDLENDPDEFQNLAGQPGYEAIEMELKAALVDFRKRTDDPFLNEQAVDEMIEFSRGSLLMRLLEWPRFLFSYIAENYELFLLDYVYGD